MPGGEDHQTFCLLSFFAITAAMTAAARRMAIITGVQLFIRTMAPLIVSFRAKIAADAIAGMIPKIRHWRRKRESEAS